LNPREACTPDGFRDRSIRPLWHPSVLEGYRQYTNNSLSSVGPLALRLLHAPFLTVRDQNLDSLNVL